MMELIFYKRKQLDIEKYDKCINSAINSVIYANSWYLDLVTEGHWNCLVWGDYAVVMPLPFQKKIFFQLIIEPPYCQQLGVFYSQLISTEIFSEFYNYLSRLKVRSYHFNSHNVAHYQIEGKKRNNNILSLQEDYTSIYKKFHQNCKRNIKKISDLSIEKMNDLQEVETLIKDNYSNLRIEMFSPIFQKLLEYICSNDKGILLGAFKDSKLVSYQLILYSYDRFIALSSGRNKKADQCRAPSAILNEFIHDYAFSKKILDFEGSDIPGIKRFNEGFGAISEYYVAYSNFQLIERWKELFGK